MNTKEILYTIGQSQLLKRADEKRKEADSLNTNVTHCALQGDLIQTDYLSAQAWALTQEADELLEKSESYIKTFMPSILGLLESDFGIKPESIVFQAQIEGTNEPKERKEKNKHSDKYKVHQDKLRDQFLAVLKEQADLGRIPMLKHIKRAHQEGRCASHQTFYFHFGSIRNALNLINVSGSSRGIEEENQPKKKRTVFDKDKVLGELQHLYQTECKGKTPTIAQLQDFFQNGKGPNPGNLRNHFGTVNKAFQEAGIPVVREHHRSYKKYGGPYTRDELMSGLHKVQEKVGRVPTSHDIIEGSKEGLCATYLTYQRHFGSIKEAREAAGIIQ